MARLVEIGGVRRIVEPGLVIVAVTLIVLVSVRMIVAMFVIVIRVHVSGREHRVRDRDPTHGCVSVLRGRAHDHGAPARVNVRVRDRGYVVVVFLSVLMFFRHFPILTFV